MAIPSPSAMLATTPDLQSQPSSLFIVLMTHKNWLSFNFFKNMVKSQSIMEPIKEMDWRSGSYMARMLL
jgi:hypothetical protein